MQASAPGLTAGSATSENPALGAQIEALLRDPAVARAHWGVAVLAMDGTPLFGRDEGKLFRPASTAKLFTTTAAMALLGPQAVVTTSAVSPQPSADGTVESMRLVGAGDPAPRVQPCFGEGEARQRCEAGSIGGGAGGAAQALLDDLAVQAAAAGVRRVSGDVVGDDAVWPSEPYPEGWELEDVLWGYGAPVSALSLADNALQVRMEAGAQAGARPRLTVLPAFGAAEVDAAGVITAARGAKTAVAVQRLAGRLVFRGTIAVGEHYDSEVAVEDPAMFAAGAFRAALITHGIAVEGRARAEHGAEAASEGFLAESRRAVSLVSPAGAPLEESAAAGEVRVIHHSPTLAEDVTVTLKTSQNLHAELLLRRLGQAFGDVPEASAEGAAAPHSPSAEGARVVRQWLLNAGLDGQDFALYDGSGLSTKDLVTPRAEAQLLAFAARQPWFAAWKAALPVGGVDGTLAGRFKDAAMQGRVLAKTGTLGESRALAGYVRCASGREVIVAILDDEHEPGSSADRTVMDRVVAAVVALE